MKTVTSHLIVVLVLATLTPTVPAKTAPEIVTLISDIQGSGTSSPLVGANVTVQAIVVGSFQQAGADQNLQGFFLQEEDADADGDPATSDGIFVFDGSSPATPVVVGDLVEVQGTVAEFEGETQLEFPTVTILSVGNPLPTAATVDLPTTGTVANSAGVRVADLEAFEGMLVSFADELTVTELFNLDRFGELRAAEGDRPVQFTQANPPDQMGFSDHLVELGRRTVTIDDGERRQNPDPVPFAVDTATAIRMGDVITNVLGVLRWSRATNDFGISSTNQTNYRVHPIQPPQITPSAAPRQPAPGELSGELTIAAFNVLNYFTTLDTGGTTPGGHDPRGADNATEFARQREKLLTALAALDADILGLIEIENDFGFAQRTTAIEDLVDGLNSILGHGTYDFVDPDGDQAVDVIEFIGGPESAGGDAIAQALLYKTATVELAPGTTIGLLDDIGAAGLGYTPPLFVGDLTNRIPIAASFRSSASNEVFTVVVNHLKSKGCGGASGANADQLDGAACWNERRTQAALAIVDWLATDPTGSGDPDVLIMGDLNAYAEEDPIIALESAGYVDAVSAFGGATGYVFDGQTGSLDYILASPSMWPQISGASAWGINADEADALDYNTDFGRPVTIFDGAVPYRSSDHDPVIVGFYDAQPIFTDGFESGSTTVWDGTVGGS
jgi:predicted extracellular nuclease